MELEAESTIPVHPAYVKPHVGLLKEPRRKSETDITDEMRANAQRLVDTLASFGVQTRIVDISRGPAVTRYELQPSAGVKISRITGLADDIAAQSRLGGGAHRGPHPQQGRRRHRGAQQGDQRGVHPRDHRLEGVPGRQEQAHRALRPRHRRAM